MKRLIALFGLAAVLIPIMSCAVDPASAPASGPATSQAADSHPFRPFTDVPPTTQVSLLTMGDWGYAKTGKQYQQQKNVSNAMADYVQKSGLYYSGAFLCGDNFYMDLKSVNDPTIKEVFEGMYDAQQLNFPFYIGLGNHDYGNGKDQIELDYSRLNPTSRFKLPNRWYREDFGGTPDHPLVSLIMLDSNKENLKDRWQDELAYLDKELASIPDGTWKVVAAHHPLYSNGQHGDNPDLQSAWGTLFKKYNVDLYVCGHDHDMQHLEIDGVFTSFMLVGGGGAQLRTEFRDARGPFSKAVAGFAHLEFMPDAFYARYVGQDGATLHAFKRDRAGKVTVLENSPSDKASTNPLKDLAQPG